MFILTINSRFYLEIHPNLIIIIINITLIIKLGAAPFHFWFPNVSEKLNWLNNFILITWQKIAPIIIISYTIQLKTFLLFFIITSTIIGAVGGFNQTSLRKLIAFSSINHLGWIISAIIFNETLWLTYFYIYSFLNMSVIFIFNIYEIFYLNQLYLNFIKSNTIKFCLIISFLSLGGLPPFLGFLPKWLIIQSLLITKINLIALIIIIMRLVTLFYYLKICLSSFLINNITINFKTKEYTKSNSFIIIFLLNFTSLSGLIITINLLFITL